jgi:hypothetical protein
MDRSIVPWNRTDACRGGRHALGFLAVLICCTLTAPAQSNPHRGDAGAPFIIRATHLLGFEHAKDNCTGTLSIHDNSLEFQQNGKAGVQMEIGAIRDIFLGEEDKQVGGSPMSLSKTAAPYGGGRMVSLFAHKKYNIMTLKYVDSDGGVHGAIFQLPKGQGEVTRNQLVARGAATSSGENQPTKQNKAEVTNENK